MYLLRISQTSAVKSDSGSSLLYETAFLLSSGDIEMQIISLLNPLVEAAVFP
jgi:hypothetical protein